MSEYELSVFAHPIIGDSPFIWHSLKFKKIAVDRDIGNYLKYISNLGSNRKVDSSMINCEDFLRLIRDGVIVTEEEDLNLLCDAIIEVGVPQIQSLFLVITRDCNLDCFYCLYGKESSQSLNGRFDSMSIETALRAVDAFVDLTKTNEIRPGYWQAITFYGGEPLLNKPVIKAVIAYAKDLQKAGRLYKGVEFIVNTNGTLVDKDFAELAQAENLEVQISLDGFKEIHDLCRPDRDGRGSFDKAFESIKELSEMGIAVVPMITITEENMEDLPRFIAWLCDKTKIERYIMNLLMSTTGNVKPGYGARAARAMWLAHCESSKVGVYDTNFLAHLNAFCGSSVVVQGCGANGRKLTVFPEGGVHTCQSLEKAMVSFVGDLSAIESKGQTFKIWRERSKLKNKVCIKCPMLGACDNGCPAGSYYASGDINAIDPNHCQWMKALFKIWLENENSNRQK